MLQERIRRALADHAATLSHRAKLIEALSRPGYALHAEGACRAGMLALEVYRSIRGSLSAPAFSAAAAVEIQTEAAFLFDNVADLKLRGQRGHAVELALAIALSECASCLACESIATVERGAAGVEALIAFHRTCIAACAGQLLDALFEERRDVTTDEALEMTRLKSGSFGRLAAGFGARAATADRELIFWFEELGQAAFTFVQLVDDLRDACSRGGADDDLARDKKTVPLAFFHNLQGPPRPVHDGGTMGVSHDVMRRRYESCGAWLFGALVAETFLNRAKRVLLRLDEKRCAVNDLERFIESLEGAFQSVLASLDATLHLHPDRGFLPARDVPVSRGAVPRLDAAARPARPDARAS